ncbi:MAG: hypothetical protein LKF53_02190 [Solobacterium sp.]|jgi:hypothetical protein|nr:hypothetical protein [Solobacterium sp.]MCH4226781.1 hypothetical protein [Solobacterium sp.]MCH4281890.1 hypothetical protein [Solobacterium sp.]
MSKIESSDFSKSIKDLLSEYSDDVKKTIDESVDDVAKEATQKLKSKNSGAGIWKKYPKTWKSNLEKGRITVTAHVYNSKNYRLTHLLEFGHAKANGGRTRAFPHIAEVNDWAQEEVERTIKEKLE